ncbi:MAG: hypothetical protein HC896_16035 [Bacteroidales bacterium]|nr:hypothetical protein [Bacteroidales bacterium]
MEYYNNILCISVPELTGGDNPIMSYVAYESYSRRCKEKGIVIKAREGKGEGNHALLMYENLRADIKEAIYSRLGDPYKTVKQNLIKTLIKPDPKALDYYQTYTKPDETHLKDDTVRKYYTNAIVLNAVHEVYVMRRTMRKKMGGSTYNIFEKIAESVNMLDATEYPHTLPNHFRRLQDKYNEYMQHGQRNYMSLIHKGECNQNSRKVSKKMERLFCSLYTMDTRPFTSTVRDMYLLFLAGNIEVVDEKTGEMFYRHDFYDKKGNPLYISESTTWRYLKQPANTPILNKLRNSAIDHQTKDLPYNHRHKPEFTLSKVSFDDRNLPRKCADGTFVWAYYAYEPLSGCFIGASYGRDKNIELVYECFRDMYNMFLMYNLPWPAEGEVERHLMSSIAASLEAIFANVRWCNPGNSREKRAEHGIKGKKYGAEKREQPNIGRWSNKHDAYQVNTDKDQRLSFDELVADDKKSIWDRNHEPHPDFSGKTRWQVLCEFVNPNLAKPQSRIIVRHIGHMTKTSIRNNDFVQCQYADYAIESTKVLSRLKPNNYDVQAYWIKNSDGNIPEIFLYQGDIFLCRATKYETYNEALAERTEKDETIRIEHAKRQANVIKTVKEGVEALAKAVIIKTPITRHCTQNPKQCRHC